MSEGLSVVALSVLDLIASTVNKLSTSAQDWGDEQLGTISVAAGYTESPPQPRGASPPVPSCPKSSSCPRLLQSTCSPLSEILQNQMTICNCFLKLTVGRYFPLQDSEAALIGSERKVKNAESIKHYKNSCLDLEIHFQQ